MMSSNLTASMDLMVLMLMIFEKKKKKQSPTTTDKKKKGLMQHESVAQCIQSNY